MRLSSGPAALDQPGALSLLHGGVPPWARLTVLVVPPGRSRAYAAEQWRDSLVVLERGRLLLETSSGARLRLQAGAVVCLARLPRGRLTNDGSVDAVLSAVSRAPGRRGPTPTTLPEEPRST